MMFMRTASPTASRSTTPFIDHLVDDIILLDCVRSR